LVQVRHFDGSAIYITSALFDIKGTGKMNKYDDYKETPLWKNAYYVAKEIRQLAENPAGNNVIFRALREKADALPVSIAIANTSSKPQEFARLLAMSYDHAHDTERLLFLTIFYGYYPDEKIRPLVTILHNVKRILVLIIAGTKTEA